MNVLQYIWTNNNNNNSFCFMWVWVAWLMVVLLVSATYSRIHPKHPTNYVATSWQPNTVVVTKPISMSLGGPNRFSFFNFIVKVMHLNYLQKSIYFLKSFKESQITTFIKIINNKHTFILKG